MLISLQTVWTQIRPDIMLGLIWIQTVRHFDDIPEIFLKKYLNKYLQMTHMLPQIQRRVQQCERSQGLIVLLPIFIRNV